MQLQIDEQIPIPVKIFSNNFIFIPKTIRKKFNWKAGDNLLIYGSKKGIFIKKEEK